MGSEIAQAMLSGMGDIDFSQRSAQMMRENQILEDAAAFFAARRKK